MKIHPAHTFELYYLKCCFFVAAVLILVKTAFLPTLWIPSPHDSELFLNLSRAFYSGRWAGSFNNLTLAKGYGYPIFLAITQILSLPAKLVEHAIYIGASFVFADSIRRLFSSHRLGFLLFIALLLNPYSWRSTADGLLRDYFYTSLTLFVVAYFINSIPLQVEGERRIRYKITFGIVLAFFYITREEAVWILPSVFVLSLLAFWSVRAISDSWPDVFRSLYQQHKVVCLTAAIFISVISVGNYIRYGTFILNDFKQGAFAEAYGAVLSVRDPEERPGYLYVSRAKLQRIAEVSAAGKVLAEQLSATGSLQGWATFACVALKLEPCPNGFTGGWFMWAFRDAVANAGHYRRAEISQVFYRTLASEIQVACKDGRLECSKQSIGILAVPNGTSVNAVVRNVWRALSELASMRLDQNPWLSHGSSTAVRRWEEAVGIGAPNANQPRSTVSGWVAWEGVSAPALQLYDERGEILGFNVTYSNDPAIVTHFREMAINVNARRFSVELSCEDPCGYRLRSVLAGEIYKEILVRNGKIEDTKGAGFLHVDTVTHLRLGFAETKRAAILSVIRPVLRVFSFCTPVAIGLALIGFLIVTLVAWDRAAVAMLIATAGLVFSRAVIVGVLEATTFPAVNALYLLPASPFLISFTVMGIYFLIRHFRSGQRCCEGGRLSCP